MLSPAVATTILRRIDWMRAGCRTRGPLIFILERAERDIHESVKPPAALLKFMKTAIALLLSVSACTLHALSPPANRPLSPTCGLRDAIAIAETEVQKIDPSYYCNQGGYQYAFMEPHSGDFPGDHWMLRFVRSGSGQGDGEKGYENFEVRVSLDGEKTIVRRIDDAISRAR